MKTVNLDTGLIAIILLSTFLLTTSFDGVETRHLERVSRDEPRGLVNNEVWRNKGKSEIRAKKKKRNPTKRKKKRKKKRKNDKLARKFNNEINNYWKNIQKDSSCSCGNINKKSKTKMWRIVNGEEATRHEFPWIISMLDAGGDWYCGGTIISDQYVVTAAHCVYGYESEPAWVRVGDHDNSDPGDTDYDHIQTFKVKKILVHRQYDERTTANDIALLKLEKRIDFSQYGGTVSPICIPKQAETYYGEKVIVAGWGLLNENGNQADKLQKVELDVLSMHACRKEFGYHKTQITSRMLCTYGERQDACQGDSGGPLIWENKAEKRYELVGVVSWGIGCAQKEHPGVFVKLAYYIKWILKKTRRSTYCDG